MASFNPKILKGYNNVTRSVDFANIKRFDFSGAMTDNVNGWLKFDKQTFPNIPTNKVVFIGCVLNDVTTRKFAIPFQVEENSELVTYVQCLLATADNPPSTSDILSGSIYYIDNE